MSWKIDPSHTPIEFSVKHTMITTVRGRFKAFDGTPWINEERLEAWTACEFAGFEEGGFGWPNNQIHVILLGGSIMPIHGAREYITEAALGWEGVTAHPHRFGGTEYRLGRRELGHIHGDHMVDIPFPKKVRDEVVDAGQAKPHHVLPESGWVSFYIREPADVEGAIALLRRSFELALNQRKKALSPTNP